MNLTDVSYSKTWRLRKWQTDKRKALDYARDLKNRCAHRPWIIEDLERELSMIADELMKRAKSGEGK